MCVLEVIGVSSMFNEDGREEETCLLRSDKTRFVHLGYTGFLGELEHLKIETRLIEDSQIKR